VHASPKLGVPKEAQSNSLVGPGFDPTFLNEMNPEFMSQMTQAIQRLPKGQLQRIRVLMQKAMNGKDISGEAQSLEKTLPAEFQNLIQTWGSLAGMQNAFPAGAQQQGEQQQPEMTEEQARKLVSEAAEEGLIPQEKAAELLETETEIEAASETAHGETPSKLTRFLKSFSRKK
jgi:hypothetical protein